VRVAGLTDWAALEGLDLVARVSPTATPVATAVDDLVTILDVDRTAGVFRNLLDLATDSVCVANGTAADVAAVALDALATVVKVD